MTYENADELTIREMIELRLCGIDAVIESVSEADPIFLQIRDRLGSLLAQVDSGEILPEYAEIQFEQVEEMMDVWHKENEVPRDPPGDGL